MSRSYKRRAVRAEVLDIEPGKPPRPFQRPGHSATCECQKCATDRRWNQIYSERIEDPDYYRRGIPHHSCLSGL